MNNSNNRRGHGGENKVKTYPCYICGTSLPSYGAHKRHISTVHGKSTKGYDRILEKELGAT